MLDHSSDIPSFAKDGHSIETSCKPDSSDNRDLNRSTYRAFRYVTNSTNEDTYSHLAVKRLKSFVQ